MTEPYDSIAKIFLGACIGGYLVQRFAIGRDSRNRKIMFVGFATKLQEELVRIQMIDFKFPDWCSVNIPKVAEECAKVHGDISCCRRSRFEIARDKFCQTKEADIINAEEQEQRAQNLKSPNYERGRERMKALLNEMIQYAK